MVTGRAAAFDSLVFGWFGHPAGSHAASGSVRFREILRDVTALGSHAVLDYLGLAAVLYLLAVRRYALGAVTFCAMAGGIALNSALKGLFDRPRPPFAAVVPVFTRSFPSGHAMLSMIAFLTVASLLARAVPDRGTRIFVFGQAIFLSIMVGLSRVWLGVHYPSDVLAGWAIGAAWALIWIALADAVEARRR